MSVWGVFYIYLMFPVVFSVDAIFEKIREMPTDGLISRIVINWESYFHEFVYIVDKIFRPKEQVRNELKVKRIHKTKMK